jgi:hypothetical protein
MASSRLNTKFRKEQEAWSLLSREMYETTSKAELAVVLYHITSCLLGDEDRSAVQARLRDEIRLIKDLLK